MKTIKIRKNSWLFKKVVENTRYNTVHESNLNLCTYMKFVIKYFAAKAFQYGLFITVMAAITSSIGSGNDPTRSPAILWFKYFFDIDLVYQSGWLFNIASVLVGTIISFLILIAMLVVGVLGFGLFYLIKKLVKSLRGRREYKVVTDSLLLRYIKDKASKVCSKIEIID